ncbi:MULTISPECIES: hypothetical protein [Nitrospirillum]|uniref:Uncharacterized protein n=1 Tax=Nitrospirillum amazonense TaxID=28077 RepID=A0A560FHM0_9PROT|nr:MULTISPECIES: hypothetical protein [Nitrospirillum]MEA1675483.1 hypothetical protein [Nitrospirillum sp. BR 11163]TWB21109.1 hypothetical protein FBZ88_11983 [Nitrospirillum amazonense]
MICGHCGNLVKEGFTTCAACGAMYRRHPGPLARLIYALLTPVILVAIICTVPAFEGDGPAATTLFVMLILLFGGMALGRVASPLRWWR